MKEKVFLIDRDVWGLVWRCYKEGGNVTLALGNERGMNWISYALTLSSPLQIINILVVL